MNPMPSVPVFDDNASNYKLLAILFYMWFLEATHKSGHLLFFGQ